MSVDRRDVTQVGLPGLRHSFDILVAVRPEIYFGETVGGTAGYVGITGGEVSGPDLAGTVLPGGADWLTDCGAGRWRLDARYVIRTDDGDHVDVRNVGRYCESGDRVSYYLTTPSFRTGAPKLSWLADSVFVADAYPISPEQIKLRVFRVDHPEGDHVRLH